MITKSKWGTRQAAPTIAGIRDDHLARYRYAGKFATGVHARTAADIGCGVGYGSFILATEFNLAVAAYEIDPEAVCYARDFYSHHLVQHHQADISEEILPPVDVVVAFEILEHFGAEEFLVRMAHRARYLVGSVPNQDLVPFDKKIHGAWHVRHYTPGEIRDTLEGAGWEVRSLGCQLGKHGSDGEILFDRTDGRTIIFSARAA